MPRIRPASLEDVHAVLSTSPSDLSDPEERWVVRSRQHVVERIGVSGCYVADLQGVGPSFMQYLFMAEDNDRLRTAFPGAFPILAADEALVEHLYVSPRARNLHVAYDCVTQVYEEARRRQAATVITFVSPSNTAAMYLSHITGFRAYVVRRRRMRFLRKTYAFEPWPSHMSVSLLDLATGSATVS